MTTQKQWQWELLPQAIAYGAETFRMAVPGGWIVRVRSEARQGRGPDYQQHPIGVSEALVFVPSDRHDEANQL